jgi:uncharacterized delta-60 repeat protein
MKTNASGITPPMVARENSSEESTTLSKTRGGPRRVAVAVGLLAGAIALAVGSAGATPGALDASFGSGGIVTTAIGNQSALAAAVALQPDGRIVAAGSAGDFDRGRRFFALARYRPNGSPDRSFGSHGTVTTAIGSIQDGAGAVALQRDGKIVVAGSSALPPGDLAEFALARYRANGTLDASFGSNGRVTTAIGDGPQDYAYGVAVQADGKIVVAGSSRSGAQQVFTLARYKTNGTLDPSFGSGGTVTTAIGIYAAASAVTLQPDAKIVVAGTTSDGAQARFALARYEGNGTLDPSFGSAGTVTTAIGIRDDGASSLVLQPDGRIVAAGHSLSDPQYTFFALARYDANGALDARFGSGGTVTTAIGSDWAFAYGLARQANGKLVAAGFSSPAGIPRSALTLARYTPEGTLDSAFGSGGTVTIQTPEAGIASAVALQPDGRIVTAGYGSGGFALARFLGDTTCLVPRLGRKTLKPAKRAIRNAHCSLGPVRKVYSAKIRKSRVVSQYPSPGKVLAEGGKVRLTISKGKRP